MTKAVDLERVRVDRLAGLLLPLLRDQGHVIQSLERVEDVDRWRRAARRAARKLGWQIATGVGDNRVWCVSKDFPRSADDTDVADMLDDLYNGAGPAVRYDDVLERQRQERPAQSRPGAGTPLQVLPGVGDLTEDDGELADGVVPPDPC